MFTGSKKARSLSTTEQTWTRAVSHGTGTTVLALQIAKPPSETSILREILSKLRNTHPLLASKLHRHPITNEWSFVNRQSVDDVVVVKFHDLDSTSALLRALSTKQRSNNLIPPCHLILEHELNDETWSDPTSFPPEGIDVIFASVYALSDSRSIVILRLHASVCDRTTAVSLLMELMAEADGRGGAGVIKNNGEGKMGIEGMIPSGMAKKTIWAHGRDMLGYSVNSFRLTNLKFKSTRWPRSTEVVRLQMDAEQTAGVLAGCKARGIKLCGALVAAALIAAHSTTNHESDHHQIKKKYGVVTLTDCRSLLQPPLSPHHFGFYHSAVLNIHTLKRAETESFWGLATRAYDDFARYKKCNKHFSDMADINFLMRKAMENPSLTASSSLRTSLVSVFEDPVIDDSQEMQREAGVEDYVGCPSIHGVGPSIGLFDTIRGGELDCACVYPSPLHSREQMDELVDHMKIILVDASRDI